MTQQRWFPSHEQLKDPKATERAFRQLLTQHYSLVDRFNDLHAKVHEEKPRQTGPPPGSGPIDSMLLGLHVVPVDVQTLADGVKLTFDKKNGNFTFK